MKIASINCSSISSHISSQISTLKHQKLYLIIDDLFKMFDEKLKRMNLLHSNQQIKKHASFSCVFHQVKITFYFKLAVNQNALISQSSKTSNLKSFQQLIFAKAIRVKFTSFIEIVSEKSIVSLYKMLFIFDDISFTFALYFYKDYAFNEDFNFCIK